MYGHGWGVSVRGELLTHISFLSPPYPVRLPPRSRSPSLCLFASPFCLFHSSRPLPTSPGAADVRHDLLRAPCRYDDAHSNVACFHGVRTRCARRQGTLRPSPPPFTPLCHIISYTILYSFSPPLASACATSRRPHPVVHHRHFDTSIAHIVISPPGSVVSYCPRATMSPSHRSTRFRVFILSQISLALAGAVFRDLCVDVLCLRRTMTANAVVATSRHTQYTVR